MVKDASEVLGKLTIKKINLHMQIADQIQDLIQNEGLVPGTRIPSERNLAEQLGVNRATLREAIRLLEQRGLLAMKPGMGTFIMDVPVDTVTESIIRYATFGKGALDDTFAYREITEPEVAALAAKNATDSDITRLQEQVGRLEEAFRKMDVESYIRADELFHEIIAEASHNMLILGIIKGLRNYLIGLRQFIIVNLQEDDIKVNRSVFEAIKNRDPEKARRAMQEHMIFARWVYESVKGEGTDEAARG